jgi:predicted Zn-dependent peptidase
MITALLTAASLVAAFQGGEDGLLPDSVLLLPEGPELVVFTAPGTNVTALRVSVALEEPAREAGAARVLMAGALQRVRTAANSVGARVSASRTPWGIAYTVVGPESHFEYMAWILREAVGEPSVDRTHFLRARDAVGGEVEHAAETAQGAISARLWNKVSPDSPPNTGSVATLEALTPAAVHDLWLRTHSPDRMTVVVSGPGSIESIIAAFKDLAGSLGARPPSNLDGRALPVADRSRVQVLRRWYGQAYMAGDPTDPHAEVLAFLAGERLREGSEGYEAGVELWDLPDRRVLAVTGAAYRQNASSVRSRIQGVLAETRADLSADRATAAATTIRFELLADARTPEGLVNLIGRHMDGTGDPSAAAEYLRRLDAVTVASLGEFVSQMEAGAVVTAEVQR